MAEPAESVPKPADFYLGLVDLFAIFMPGALVVLVLAHVLELEAKLTWLTGARGWVAFVAGAYVAGHLAHALGGVLLDRLYDKGYRLLPDHEDYYALRLRAKDLAETLLKNFYSPSDNVLEWSAAFVRLGSGPASVEIDRLEADSKFFRSLCVVVILTWPVFISQRGPLITKMPVGWAEWSYVLLGVLAWLLSLGSVAPVVYLRHRAFKEDKEKRQLAKLRQLESATSVESTPTATVAGEAPAIHNPSEFAPQELPPGPESLLGYSRRAVQWLDRQLSRSPTGADAEARAAALAEEFQKRVEAEIRENEESARKWWQQTRRMAGISVVLILASAFVLPAPWRDPHPYLWHARTLVVGLAASALAVFSAWRYMERRLKRTQLTYSFAIALSKAPRVAEPARAPGSPG